MRRSAPALVPSTISSRSVSVSPRSPFLTITKKPFNLFLRSAQQKIRPDNWHWFACVPKPVTLELTCAWHYLTIAAPERGQPRVTDDWRGFCPFFIARSTVPITCATEHKHKYKHALRAEPSEEDDDCLLMSHCKKFWNFDVCDFF